MSSTNYQSQGFVEPAQAEAHFAQQFDLSNPDYARTSYQRLIHQHTKQQFETATASSRRRSTNTTAPLSTESSRDSVSSTAS